VFLASMVTASVAQMSCLDASGNPVDYWIGLKHNAGVALTMYNPLTQAFSLDQSLSSQESAFAQTMNQIYTGSPAAYVMYNDETPAGVEMSTHAHMKGVMGLDVQQGFWLVHSVPKFPATLATYSKSGYAYPNPEMVYGQSFMCLTLNTATFDTVAQALYIDWPQIYDSTFSSKLSSTLPTLAKVLAKKKASGAQVQMFNITTVAGKLFTVFAKNREWNSELYLDAVAPYYSDGLYAETWLNGVGLIGSVCQPYPVFDVAVVTLPGGARWTINDDHSKWAITQKLHYVCVGDINREYGQFKRGGGTVCTLDDAVWGAFSAIITSVNSTCGAGPDSVFGDTLPPIAEDGPTSSAATCVSSIAIVAALLATQLF